MSETRTETIYIAPGYNSCRVYAIPYPMRPNQRPADILPQYQSSWREVAMLNHRLELRYIEADYVDLKDDIEGQMGGTFFAVERPVPQNSAQA
ncbi:hypothetical protein F6X40_23905 [Paraburkholderia sp. UCT31]|uniref:hypothetical protein n=1 Tax=Paraburkholderia sp. UCT31 TaxID=2615209 RepID=UPI0016555B00|nr:hypothetical protein [Paraburkholderia sp. UCT31]MBC8739761.1 hypothetical protein [Paraburkholderia sp. UCT31]